MMLRFALVCPSKRSLKNISTQTVLWNFVVTCVYMFLLHKYCIIYNAHASFYCFVLGNHICMSFISIFTLFLYLRAVVALHVWGKFIFSHFYSKKMSALVLCHVEAISFDSRFVLCDAIDILQQRKCESISYEHQHLLCVALFGMALAAR